MTELNLLNSCAITYQHITALSEHNKLCKGGESKWVQGNEETLR